MGIVSSIEHHTIHIIIVLFRRIIIYLFFPSRAIYNVVPTGRMIIIIYANLV